MIQGTTNLKKYRAQEILILASPVFTPGPADGINSPLINANAIAVAFLSFELQEELNNSKQLQDDQDDRNNDQNVNPVASFGEA